MAAMMNLEHSVHGMADLTLPPDSNDPRLLAAQAAENAYADQELSQIADATNALAEDMASHIPQQEASLPWWAPGPPGAPSWWYQRRRGPGDHRWRLVRWPAGGGAAQMPCDVIFDENEEAVGQPPGFDISACSVSPDGQWLAFTEDAQGDELHTLVVWRLGTAAQARMHERCLGPELAWTADSGAVVALRLTPDTHAPVEIVLCSIVIHDDLRLSIHSTRIFTCPDGAQLTWLPRQDSSTHHLTLRTARQGGSALHVLPMTAAQAVTGVLTPLPWQDEWDVLRAAVWQDRFVLLLLDTDDEPDGSIVAISCMQPHASASMLLPPHTWLVPGLRGAGMLRDMALVQGSQPSFLAVTRVMFDSLQPHVDIYSLPADLRCHSDGNGGGGNRQPLQALWTWTIPGACGPAALSIQPFPGPPDAPRPRLLVTYSRLTTPKTSVVLDVATRASTVVHIEPVPGMAPIESYAQELVWARSADGTHVPVTLAYRSDLLARDGSNICFLHVYGAYGAVLSPEFNPHDVALLDRGVVVALAHVRGGGELGAAWHAAARRRHKHRTFDDLVAAAAHLCCQVPATHISGGAGRITSPNRLALWARSAGGLAAAASIAAHPRLVRAAVLDMPFLDVLTAMHDASLPLTRKEHGEWGDPAESSEDADIIRGYCPFASLPAAVARAGCAAWASDGDGAHAVEWALPDLLVTGAGKDVRVPPWIPTRRVVCFVVLCVLSAP